MKYIILGNWFCDYMASKDEYKIITEDINPAALKRKIGDIIEDDNENLLGILEEAGLIMKLADWRDKQIDEILNDT